MKIDVAIIIPNWNGKDRLKTCLDSVLAQTVKTHVILVENGSTDGSVEYLEKNYPQVKLIKNTTNLGFAGGVNGGIKLAESLGSNYVALLNNDAVIDKKWVAELLESLKANKNLGAVGCKLLSFDKKHIDSTGDFFSSWGTPFNRQRDIDAADAISEPGYIFGPCAGAAMYRLKALDEVGLFDEDFFAYHEDGDLSFRLQLGGWKTLYVPTAEAYHATGSTSSKIPGFTTYQTFKNLPLLVIKNVPLRLLPSIGIRFAFLYCTIFVSAVLQGRGWPALKGFSRMLTFVPKKLIERHRIHKNRKVSVSYIQSIIVWDLPPNATKLRRLRTLLTPWRRPNNK